MKSPFYVELLTRHDDIGARHRFMELPIRIGRGYDNDLIVDDPYVAEHHVKIVQTEHGQLVIEDLGSQNGMLDDGKRVMRAILDPDRVIRIGHTRLRVRCADYAVPHSMADTSAYRWEGWPPAMAGLSIIALLSMLSVWGSDTDSISPIHYLSGLAMVLSVVFVWCGIWSFANRVIANHARFGRHVFIVGCALLAMEVWDMASMTTAYALSWEWLTRYGEHVVVAIGALMIFGHLMTITQQHPKRFLVFAILLSSVGSGLILMNNYQQFNMLAGELYMNHLLPPALRMTADKSMAQFFEAAATLKPAVDKAKDKPADANPDLLEGAQENAE